MSKDEKITKIGELVLELDTQVQELKRARDEAKDVVPQLRKIADCLDESETEKMEYVMSGTFKSNITNRKLSIPDSSNITGIMSRMHSANERAKSILRKLKTEHIDICDICDTLAKMDSK